MKALPAATSSMLGWCKSPPASCICMATTSTWYM